MKKSKLLLLGAVLASFSLSAVAKDEPFDPDKISSRYNHYTSDWGGKRYLTSFNLTNTTGSDVLLNEPTFSVGQTDSSGSLIYFDRTSLAPFQTKPGNTVALTPTWNGAAMHGYLFIDYNKDGGFNSKLNNTGLSNDYKSKSFGAYFDADLNPSAEGELVSFSAYQLSDGTYVNSTGSTVTDPGSVRVTPPTFTIPADLKPGTYNALYKIDWSNLEQHGCTDSNNLIGNNGGCIVQFQIEVVESAWLSDLDGLEEHMTLLEGETDKKIAVRRDFSTQKYQNDAQTIEVNNRITIMNKVYDKGVGTHATSNAIVELNGATSFYTVVGIDDEVLDARYKNNECEVDFIITLYNSENRGRGGVEAYKQHVKMSESVYAFEFNSGKSNYNLADYDYMKLTVAAGTQPWSDHADWADARFLYKGIKPRFIAQEDMFKTEIRHTATTTDEVSAYANAAFVTIEYDARFIPEEHELIAVATQINGPQSSATASSFTTLALTQEEQREALNGVIQASKAENNGKKLTYSLRKDESSAKLLLEEPIFNDNGKKVDNRFTANTSYTYSIQIKTDPGEDSNDDPITALAHEVSFKTADNGDTLGVEDVVEDDSNAPVQYFNLQGIQVNQPAAGQIYIVRQGKSVKKVLVK